MDGKELARQMEMWWLREFEGIKMPYDTILRSGDKISLEYDGYKHFFEFEGDEGGKGRERKPFRLNVYISRADWTASSVEGLAKKAGETFKERGKALKEARDSGPLTEDQKNYAKLFSRPKVSAGEVEYEGTTYVAVKVSAGIKSLPRGHGGKLSPKLFAVGRRELVGPARSAI